MVSVTIRQLTKRFGRSTVLHGVDLEIREGELFFLLGPSGCGKTTLLRHIAGFYEPDEGSILFDDKDVTRMPAHQREAGMMFQSYALWPHLTVAQNVAFGLEERKRPAAEIAHRVEEALEQVQLGGLGGRRIQQLSSSSGWRWRARWSFTRTACCSMSRCPIWTPSCASRCVRKSAAFAKASA